jgi:hypothetical protein
MGSGCDYIPIRTLKTLKNYDLPTLMWDSCASSAGRIRSIPAVGAQYTRSISSVIPL